MANILVIEDDRCFRRLLVKILGREGHVVHEAADGVEGLAHCRRYRPDLVITDIVMPEKEGIETILELAREYPGLPVLAISGAACAPMYLRAATALGSAASLPKPFRREELLDAIGDLLSQKGEA
jgi:DNA-binding NtrC family response regulator